MVFTYLLKEVIEGRSGIPIAVSTKARLQLFFGLEPREVQTFLQRFNLTIVEDIGTEEYRKGYPDPIGRNLVVTTLERSALARVAGAPGSTPGKGP
ncbi:MAG TPA: hypothetical protein VMB35_09135 [Methanomicrobiales archaeon]|nr:hypothetical protein [Methanomicrobiales archaeon]